MFDIALLDLNLDGQSSAPVAEIIDKRGPPFLFISGYQANGLPEPFESRPHLNKPFVISKLAAFIEEMLER